MHVGEHADRGDRDRPDLPATRGPVAELGEEEGEMAALHVQGPLLAEVLVERLANAAERLPGELRLRLEPIGVRARQPAQDERVEAFPVLGDDRHEVRESDGRVVRVRGRAAGAGSHQHGADEDGPRLEQEFVRRQISRIGEPLLEPLDRHLAKNEPAILALAVEVMRVPLAEAVVGPLVRGMAEVVAARVESELVEQGRIEVGPLQQARADAAEDLHRLGDKGLIRTMADAGAAEKERDRSDSFVVVDLAEPTILEDRDGAMTDVVVQLLEAALDDPRGVFPGAAKSEDRLGRAGQEERDVEIALLEMEEKIGMMPAIRGDNLVEQKPNRGGRLGRLLERGLPFLLEAFEGGVEILAELKPGCRIAGRRDLGTGVVEAALEPRIGPALGEVQIAQNRFQVGHDTGAFLLQVIWTLYRVPALRWP